MKHCTRCGKYFLSDGLCQCGGTGEEYSSPVRRHSDPSGRDEPHPYGDPYVSVRIAVDPAAVATKAAAIEAAEEGEDRYERSIVITRHSGLVEWLRRRGIEAAHIVEHAAAADVVGRIVYGVLPLSLAAEAAEVWTVSMPGLRPEQRGVDLTPEEMDAAGAMLEGFRVTRIQGRQ